ncbi:hypothetical protein LZ31DRAFT_374099 [Colletotrichum somersetense]|nr:hypothetical protein LZ31DRAFT_374099 [Colletotrichum somersetense]
MTRRYVQNNVAFRAGHELPSYQLALLCPICSFAADGLSRAGPLPSAAAGAPLVRATVRILESSRSGLPRSPGKWHSVASLAAPVLLWRPGNPLLLAHCNQSSRPGGSVVIWAAIQHTR